MTSENLPPSGEERKSRKKHKKARITTERVIFPGGGSILLTHLITNDPVELPYGLERFENGEEALPPPPIDDRRLQAALKITSRYGSLYFPQENPSQEYLDRLREAARYEWWKTDQDTDPGSDEH